MTDGQKTLTNIQVCCLDKYEAQKMSSMIFQNKDRQVFIKDILSVYENEVVVSLLDRSAHCIMLRDVTQTEKFADFIQQVVECNQKITDVKIVGDTVLLTKENSR
ncbi:hypothetical protein [Nitrosopumilus sp.]|uniref:hypothetical protein n=1 Tax=Nitrosopumilus sp. TaxID=2024843 RepID=UPI0026399252|nr:hypothetical protein [Nitrosopumilus sp.]